MTNAKEYLKFHIKSNFRAMICILSVVLVLTLLFALTGQPYERYEFDRETETATYYEDYYSTLYIPVVFLGMLTYVLPVMEFGFFKKRANLNCVYSLPISRKSLGCVHYISGLVSLYTIFTCSYLLNFILLLSRGKGFFHFGPIFAHYFLCLLVGFAMYSIMVFVFNEANTTADGIWFMVLYSIVFWFVAMTCSYLPFFENNMDILEECPFTHWGVISKLTTHYQHLAEINYASKAKFWSTPIVVFAFIFYVAVGIASAVGFFFTFGKRRMEKTEEVSDSYFGYRTLIPVYALLGAFWGGSSGSMILGLIFAFCAFVGYTIYRRGFHYKKDDVIYIIGTVIISIIGQMLS